MKRPFETALYGTSRYLPGRSRLAFFLVFFLLNIFFGWGQDACVISSSEPNPTDTSPIPLDLNFEGPVNRPLVAEDFEVPNGTIGNIIRETPEFVKGAENIEIENFQVQGSVPEIISRGIPEFLADEFGDAVISITQYTEDDIFYLTYSNGVKTLNLVTENKQATSISGGNLSSPLDIEASRPGSNQYLYLADKREQQVNVYNNSATAKLDDFKVPNYDSSNDVGPTGIVTDGAGNIYVTVAFTPTGTYDVEYDKVAVYQPGNYTNPSVFPSDNSGLKLDRPYRIAVDKLGRVYVADSGGSTSNGRVLIFDENYNHIHTIEGTQDNIGAPGSIVVDDFGYIYIIDYQNDITFNGIFQNPEDLIAEYDKISSTSYSINVYDSNANFEYVTEFNQGLNLPVDLEIDYCGNILVNNLELTGPVPGLSGIDINFDFQLKTFTRYDNFTAEITPEFDGTAEVSLNTENDFFPCDPQPECEFSIFYEVEVEPQPVVTCPQNSALPELPLDANCDYQLPVWGDLIETENFTPTFDLKSEAVANNKLQVEVEVLNGTDLIETCSLEFDFVDKIKPVITSCPDDENIILNPGETYTVPNYQPMIGISDNCDSGPEYSQTPIPGAEISENTPVNITVTDASGNPSECNFIIVISEEEEEELSITCPDDQNINYNQNCSFELPNYTNEANASPGATITQEPEPGTVLSADTQVTLTATLDGESISCPFMVIPADNEKPIINCPGEQIENYDPEVGFVIPNYISQAGISDNCNLDQVEQTPAEGTTFFGDTELTITATDENGNFETCSFWIRLTENEVLEISCPENKSGILDDSCNYVVPDFTGEAQVNFNNAVITQDPEPGEIISESTPIRLTAEADGQQDTCVFQLDLSDTTPPVASCVDNFTLQLDANGEASITEADVNNNSSDGCGIESFVIDKSNFTTTDIGENPVTLTVTDIYGNTDTCSTTVTIEPYAGGGGDFQCKEEITLQLDQTGAASFVVEDLYTGDASGLSLVASQLNFTCDDLGENSVELSWTGQDVGSCELIVMVEDNIKPVAEVGIIGVTLEANGRVEITPEDLDAGSSDNCGSLDFSLSKTRFTCQDTGQNTVVFTVTDASGNSVSVNTVVFVNATPGTCTEPVRDNDYLFLYPNPTDGLVKISPPSGVMINQVFVFDKRGRLILSKDFDKSDLEYELQLDGVQNAVYTLKILTDEGEVIRRLIVRN